MADVIRSLRQKLQNDGLDDSPSKRDGTLFRKIVLVLFIFTATAVIVSKSREPPRQQDEDPLFQTL